MKPIMSKKMYNIIDFLFLLAVLFFVMWFVSSHYGISSVPSESMYPTIRVKSFVIYEIKPADELNRDDIATFFPDSDGVSIHSGFDSLKYYYGQKKELYVKRVIGLPGDVIEVRDGYVWRNGKKLDEPYVNDTTDGVFEPCVVEDEHIFFMGDNRNNSYDSRFFGAVPYNGVVGKVIFIFTPPWLKN